MLQTTHEPDVSGAGPGPSSTRENPGRILHLLSGQERGGIQHVVEGISRGLAREFGDMTVACLSDSDLGLPRGVSTVTFPARGHWLRVSKVVEFARQGRFDLVHSHSLISNPYGWAIRSRIGGLQHVAHVHSHLSHLARSQSSWLKRVLLLWGNVHALRGCERVVAVADSVRSHLVRLGIDPLRIEVIRNGVDLARIECQAREDCEVAAALQDRARGEPGQGGGRSGRCPVVVSIGRLAPIKNHRLLIEAAGIVLRQQRAVFVIAGDGPQRADLERRARQAGVAQNVLFVGWLRQPYPLLSVADLIVLTSWSEGLPISILEAMALGKPVVATRVGGIPEVVRDGVSGELVDPGNAEALAASLLRMLADAERRRAFGRAGRAIVEEEFSNETMLRKLADVYRPLLSRARRAASMVQPS
jgi:glycosyltransferase involved in cell wall biosynthesis